MTTTTLAHALSASDQSITLVDPEDLSSGQLLALDAEYCRVLKALTATQALVQRGVNGTPSAPHQAGVTVSIDVPEGFLTGPQMLPAFGIDTNVLTGLGPSDAATFQPATGGGGTPSAPDTSVQFNNAGAFGGSADFTWDGTHAFVGGSQLITYTDLASPPPGTALGSSALLFTDLFQSGTQQVAGGTVIGNTLANTGPIASGSLLIGSQSYGFGAGAPGTTQVAPYQIQETFSGSNANLTSLGLDAIITWLSSDNYSSPVSGYSFVTSLTGNVDYTGSVFTQNSSLKSQLNVILGSTAHTIENIAAASFYTAVNTGTATLSSTLWLVNSVYADGLADAVHILHIDSPDFRGTSGQVDTSTAVWVAEQNSTSGASATNAYSFWSDERGVAVLKSVSDFDAVYQANWRIYNPQFTKYTPGATNREYIVTGQWNGNVGEIGTVATGTGTARTLRLIGNALNVVPAATFNSTVTATDHVWTGTKTANFVLAGPTTGSPAVPAFRALVSADIPTGAYGGVTSLAGTSNQITASAATGAVTLSITTNPTIPGHITTEGVTATGATGTGKFVFDNTPTLITPVLGVASATSLSASGAVYAGAGTSTTMGIGFDTSTGFYRVGSQNIGVNGDTIRLGTSTIAFGGSVPLNWYTGGAFAAISCTINGNIATGVFGLTGASTGAALQLTEMTAPAAPATNSARLYCEDTGGGKTRLVVLFPTGAAQVIATEP